MTDTFEDGRVDLRGTEIYAVAREVSEHFTGKWLRDNMNSYGFDGGQRLNDSAALVEFPTGSKWEVVYSAPWKVT